MGEKRTPGEAAGDGPDTPFLSRADQPFEPAPEGAGLGEAARIAHALEYIAYQLYHVREALGELAAAAEPAPGRGRSGRSRHYAVRPILARAGVTRLATGQLAADASGGLGARALYPRASCCRACLFAGCRPLLISCSPCL